MNTDLYWAKVKKTDSCWFWTGAKTDGYGAFNHERKNYKAHRAAWELENGDIPDGMQIDHMCGIRSCVNPEHLRLITQTENLYSRNHQYKRRSQPTKSKKSYCLYIHHPRFKEEERKGELINRLLNEYYEDTIVEKKYPKHNPERLKLKGHVTKDPIVPGKTWKSAMDPDDVYAVCKHNQIKGMCKKGCK